MFCKKELAGRTMEFTFDVSQTPLIGRRILLKTDDNPTIIGGTNSSNASTNTTVTTASSATVLNNAGAGVSCTVGAQARNVGNMNAATQGNYSSPTGGAHLQHNNSAVGTPNSPRRSASLSPADSASLSGWKRPWMSQGRVRECLVNLLTTCGQRVGLPKSPSVCMCCLCAVNTTILNVRVLSMHRLSAYLLCNVLFSAKLLGAYCVISLKPLSAAIFIDSAMLKLFKIILFLLTCVELHASFLIGYIHIIHMNNLFSFIAPH